MESFYIRFLASLHVFMCDAFAGHVKEPEFIDHEIGLLLIPETDPQKCAVGHGDPKPVDDHHCSLNLL